MKYQKLIYKEIDLELKQYGTEKYILGRLHWYPSKHVAGVDLEG